MSGLVGEVNENIQVKNGQEKYDVKLGIREWKRYPEYKDSGMEWIGQIPKKWEVKPLKFASELNPEALPENTDPDYILKYIDIGNVSLGTLVSEPTEMKFCNSPSRARKIVKNGDIIISTVRTYLKAILLITNPDPNLIVSTGFAVIRSSLFNNPKYLYYAVRSTNFIEAVMAHSEGIGYPAINTSVLGKLPILIPSSIEQQDIVNFLDRETSKIDTLIEKKQRLIELLEEKRSALISHAVTKGLDLDVKMKDLGVEWIGDIPDQWDVSKLGAKCSIKARIGWKGLKASEYVEEGYIFLSTPNIKNRDIDFNNINFISEERYLESPEIMLEVGDVLIAKDGSTLGITNVVKYLPDKTTVNSSIAVIRPFKDCNSIYLNYFLQSSYTQNVIQRMKGGMGVPHLFQADLRNFTILCPPLSEQQLIANFLDSETEKIDTFINKISAQIEKLKEYRTALISAAVTGKIDVREEVA